MKFRKALSLLLSVVLLLSLFTGCSSTQTELTATDSADSVTVESTSSEPSSAESSTEKSPADEDTSAPSDSTAAQTTATEAPTGETSATETSAAETEPEASSPVQADSFDPSSIPAYSGAPYAAIHGNIPFFAESEITAQSFERYAPLDGQKRCGPAVASVGRDLMPTEPRGSIGQVKPSGWHTVKYDCVDGKYLYNRCHLIGFQLTGENANQRNLVTGTRYMNVQGMLPFENMVADFVKETGNHVMYRVTPVFRGKNLVCDGVLMEALSVEDAGEGICFCVFVYNVQPGIRIDYADGSSASSSQPAQPPATEPPTQAPATEPPTQAPTDPPKTEPEGVTYVLNVNTGKFHRPTCSSVSNMNESNKQYVTCSREELIAQGYTPCKRCKP